MEPGRAPGSPLGDVPIDDDHYARAPSPSEVRALPSRSGGRRESGGSGLGGLGGLLKLILFIVILAGVVLVAGLTVLRPVISHAVVDYATNNPSALKLPFVADLVREDLGAALTDAPSTSATEVKFDVIDGDTAESIATRLQRAGLLRDARSLIFIATEQDLTTSLQSGTYFLRTNMTPQQIVTSLLVSHQVAVAIGLRPSLRLEQITAKLQTVPGLTMDVKAFYDEVKHPPATLLNDYPWLTGVLPKGRLAGGLPGCRHLHRPARHHGRRVRADAPRRLARAGRRRAARRAGRPRPDLLPGPVARLDRRARDGQRPRPSEDRRASTRTGRNRTTRRPASSGPIRRFSISTTPCSWRPCP